MITVTPDQTLGYLTGAFPGATRVFHQFNIDFCCGGNKTLGEVVQTQGLDLAAVTQALQALSTDFADSVDWRTASAADLVEHIISQFHERHREQLPELIRLARIVERVHASKEACPKGLADSLAAMHKELETHMQKEEQVLFPMLMRGMDARAQAPISVLRHEHDTHGDALEAIIALTDNITAPADACSTWRALYAGIVEFKEDLMQHIHLENNVLFARSTSVAALAPQG